eukprot:2814804-Rhodomonas_salina.1
MDVSTDSNGAIGGTTTTSTTGTSTVTTGATVVLVLLKLAKSSTACAPRIGRHPRLSLPWYRRRRVRRGRIGCVRRKRAGDRD